MRFFLLFLMVATTPDVTFLKCQISQPSTYDKLQLLAAS